MNDELYHYGVLGMKWGRRKASSSSDSSSSSQRKRKKEKVSNLSDEELKKRINRLNLEKQYKDLTKKEDKKVSDGRKLVKGIVNKSVSKVVQPELEKLLEKGVSKLKKTIKNRGKASFDFSDFVKHASSETAAQQVKTVMSILPILPEKIK